MSKPVTDVAKNATATDNIVMLPDGRRGKIVPVSMSLIDAVSNRMTPPDPPVVFIEDKGREEPNPADPQYIRAMDQFERDRGIAVMDAMVMFGLELLDGIPPDEEWLPKLKFMAKRGTLNLDDYDLNDEVEREFAYKRLIVTPPWLIEKISNASGMTQEEVDRAEDSFPGN